MRLDKFLSKLGIGSRKEVALLIKRGRVTINGIKVTDPGVKVNLEKDVVQIDGKEVRGKVEGFYYKFYKPRGCVTSKSDKDLTVMDFLPKDLPGLNRIFPVGRLDKDAEGLLIFTDDGALAHRMMHPKWKLSKTYQVWLDKEITELDLKKIEEGVELSDGKTLPCTASFLDETKRWIKIEVREGRYHLIKRMFGSLGYKVIGLKRIAIGSVELGELKPSEIVPLSEEEVKLLKKAVGL